jgi:bifunctional non-homologous end joining protein LigD
MKFVEIKGTRKLPKFVEPMGATLSKRQAFDDPEWIFELKWDGYRAVAEITKDTQLLYSRNGQTFDKAYPYIFEALKSIKKRAIIDGEIVALDEHGKPNFQLLQNYGNNKRVPLQYYVFDCLELDGKDLTGEPLIKRKAVLKKLLPAKSKDIVYCDHIEEDGIAFFREVKKMHLEGMIAKRKNSIYRPGSRSQDWLKIKNIQGQEVIIVGFTPPKGSRKHFGALVLGTKIDGKLTGIGKVGTGFSDATLKTIYKLLEVLVVDKSPLQVMPKERIPQVTWVKPKLVCNISYSEITSDGSVRHPVFLGLRADKKVNTVKLEIPD